ncbi:hypothetical protein CC80DRAFT_532587 [Byssothecium circinans]|uniref:Uncharacterized protein n=1 Tax=Byssothecium circinans TaxID=147558 RepID=A0A6A5U864_9PLEO|nr:hypothetical protein CC80DRAFT_532587 [Byssothecium circinans]
MFDFSANSGTEMRRFTRSSAYLFHDGAKGAKGVALRARRKRQQRRGEGGERDGHGDARASYFIIANSRSSTTPLSSNRYFHTLSPNARLSKAMAKETALSAQDQSGSSGEVDINSEVPLFKLPGEIRNRIYAFAIQMEPNGLDHNGNRTGKCLADTNFYALTKASRQLRLEFGPLWVAGRIIKMYGKSLKRFFEWRKTPMGAVYRTGFINISSGV